MIGGGLFAHKFVAFAGRNVKRVRCHLKQMRFRKWNVIFIITAGIFDKVTKFKSI